MGWWQLGIIWCCVFLLEYNPRQTRVCDGQKISREIRSIPERTSIYMLELQEPSYPNVTDEKFNITSNRVRREIKNDTRSGKKRKRKITTTITPMHRPYNFPLHINIVNRRPKQKLKNTTNVVNKDMPNESLDMEISKLNGTKSTDNDDHSPELTSVKIDDLLTNHDNVSESTFDSNRSISLNNTQSDLITNWNETTPKNSTAFPEHVVEKENIMINDTSIISSNEGNSSTSSLPINDKEIKENKISVEQTSPEPITNIAQNVPNNSSLANVTSKSDLIMNDELSEQTTSAIGKNIIIDDKSTNETIPTIKSKDVTDPQKKTGLSNIEEPSNLPHKASNSTEKLLNNTVSSGKSKSSNSSEENNLLNSYEVSLPEISSSKNQTADETESKYSPNLSDELNLINQGKQIQQDNSSQIFDHSHLHKTLESHLKDNKTLNNTDSKHYNNEKENPNGTTTIKNSELGNLDEPSTPNQKIFTPLTSTNSESSNNTIPSLNLSEINKHNHLQNSSNSTHIIPNSDLHKTISNKDIDSPNTTVSGDNENINNKTVSSDKPVDTNESTVSFPINTPNLSSNSNSALNSTNINTIPGIENPKHEHNKTSENIPPEENETTIPKNDTGSQNYTNTETAQFSQLTETPDDPLNITDTRNIDVSNSSYSGSSSSADAHSYHETIPTQTGNETKSYATAEAEAESFTETKKVTHEDDILSGTDVVPDLLFHNKTIPGYNGTINIMENGTSGFTFTELKNITIEEDNVSGSISSARAFAFDDIESDSDKNKTKNVTQVEETESAVLNFNETRTVTTENDIIIMAIPDAAETSNATSPFSNKTGNLTDNLVASPAEYIVEVRKLITINDTINESAESATALSYHKTGLNGTDADKNITISAASDGNVTITITRVIEEDIYKRVSADEIAKYEGNSSSVNNTKSFDLAAADAVGTVIATVYHNSTKETVSGSEAVATATTNGTNTTSYTAVMNTGSPIIIEDISSESVEIVPENRHIDALNNTSREDFIPESSESSNTDSAPGDEDQISK